MAAVLRTHVASLVDLDLASGVPDELVAALNDPRQRVLQELEETGLEWMDELSDESLNRAVQQWQAAVPESSGYEQDEDQIRDTCWFAWLYGRSASWLWYPRFSLDRSEASLFHERRRLYLTPEPDDDAGIWRTTILILPRRRVGVVTTWFIETATQDPWEAKTRPWSDPDALEAVFRPVRTLLPDFTAERQYPFISVQLAEDDLTRFYNDNFRSVGSWLTGGYESESDERLRVLISPDNNLSSRRYERLFLRWTDALALYNQETLPGGQERDRLLAGEPVPDPVYQQAKLRAAQLFEHCILARRMIRTDAREVTARVIDASVVRDFPVVSRGWRRAHAVLASLSLAEHEMITAPPVCSVEAEELVDGALARFGVPQTLEDTRHAYELLERRLQWIRAQWLAVFAVLAFVVTAIIDLL